MTSGCRALPRALRGWQLDVARAGLEVLATYAHDRDGGQDAAARLESLLDGAEVPTLAVVAGTDSAKGGDDADEDLQSAGDDF
jgi:hypothetical protein